jgi:hypothetical protein
MSNSTDKPETASNLLNGEAAVVVSDDGTITVDGKLYTPTPVKVFAV